MNAPLHGLPGPGPGAISPDCSSGADGRVGRGPLVVTEPSAVAQRRAFCLRGRGARAGWQWCMLTPGSKRPRLAGKAPALSAAGPMGPAALGRPGGRSGSWVTAFRSQNTVSILSGLPVSPSCLLREGILPSAPTPVSTLSTSASPVAPSREPCPVLPPPGSPPPPR